MTYTDTLFDSVISLQIYDKKDRDILEECKELCQKYDAMFSRTNEESEVSRINNAQGNPVEVSPDTAKLVKKGLYYGKLSNGAFDITQSVPCPGCGILKLRHQLLRIRQLSPLP